MSICGRKSKVVDEASAIHHQPPKEKERDIVGDIIIYTLSGLCILLFIFIIIGFFLIAKPLTASLTSVELKNLRYSNNSLSSSYFNASLAMGIKIKNPNYGFFEFSDSKGDVSYNGRVIGEMKINGGRVDSYGVIRREVKTEVSYRESETSVWFENDVKRKLMILKIDVKLRGGVHLMVLNKRSVNLKCLMYLNLRDEVVKHLWCK